MKKVLHIHVDLDVAGAQTVIMNFFRYLDKDPDVEMILLVHGCPKNSAYEQECQQKGYKIIYNGYKPWVGIPLLRSLVNWLKSQIYIYRSVRQIKPDFIHTHGTTLLPFASIPTAMCCCKKKFHTLHGDPYALNGNYVRWAKFAFNILNFYPICVTDVQAKKAVARYKLDKYSVIKNGIDGRRFVKNCREEVRNEFNISDKTFVVGCVGRFDKIKNHQFLVRIFAEFVKQQPEALLMLVGDGSEKRNIENVAASLGVGDKILFTGLRNDVERMYYAMDLFMLTSFYESSSIVTVEAQFAGIRCVIADSIPENVVLAPLVNRISLEASNDIWLKAMNGKLSTDAVKGSFDDFSIEKSIKELKCLYLKEN